MVVYCSAADGGQQAIHYDAKVLADLPVSDWLLDQLGISAELLPKHVHTLIFVPLTRAIIATGDLLRQIESYVDYDGCVCWLRGLCSCLYCGTHDSWLLTTARCLCSLVCSTDRHVCVHQIESTGTSDGDSTANVHPDVESAYPSAHHPGWAGEGAAGLDEFDGLDGEASSSGESGRIDDDFGRPDSGSDFGGADQDLDDFASVDDGTEQPPRPQQPPQRQSHQYDNDFDPAFADHEYRQQARAPPPPPARARYHEAQQSADWAPHEQQWTTSPDPAAEYRYNAHPYVGMSAPASLSEGIMMPDHGMGVSYRPQRPPPGGMHPAYGGPGYDRPQYLVPEPSNVRPTGLAFQHQTNPGWGYTPQPALRGYPVPLPRDEREPDDQDW